MPQRVFLHLSKNADISPMLRTSVKTAVSMHSISSIPNDARRRPKGAKEAKQRASELFLDSIFGPRYYKKYGICMFIMLKKKQMG